MLSWSQNIFEYVFFFYCEKSESFFFKLLNSPMYFPRCADQGERLPKEGRWAAWPLQHHFFRHAGRNPALPPHTCTGLPLTDAVPPTPADQLLPEDHGQAWGRTADIWRWPVAQEWDKEENRLQRLQRNGLWWWCHPLIIESILLSFKRKIFFVMIPRCLVGALEEKYRPFDNFLYYLKLWWMYH